MSEMTLREFAAMGGKARASKYSKEQLSEWSKRGGRPKKLPLDKLASNPV